MPGASRCGCCTGTSVSPRNSPNEQAADLLTLEEYFPYGGVDQQNCWRNAVQVRALFGKERDVIGLYYSFRYYVPWLRRGLSPDPAGIVAGLNLFRKVRNDPIIIQDQKGLFPRKLKTK